MKTLTTSTTVNGTVWMEQDGVRFFGPGPYELLGRIAEVGSLHVAAATMGMSYRKAWVIVDRINRVMGRPVVVSQKGGMHGGGSTLSPEALELMERYQKLASAFAGFLDQNNRPLP
jgi:molybdate transport system regulatory protein